MDGPASCNGCLSPRTCKLRRIFIPGPVAHECWAIAGGSRDEVQRQVTRRQVHGTHGGTAHKINVRPCTAMPPKRGLFGTLIRQ